EWDGTAWSQRAPALSPTGRYQHAMAYDSARQRTVVFGGLKVGGQPPLGDTAEWDGTSWSLVTTPLPPAARSAHAMAYDSLRARVVLFGGSVPPSTALFDTWDFDGSAWTQRTTSLAP